MSFFLSQPNKEKSLIILSYNKKLDKLFRYSTGLNIETRFWSKENQRATVAGTDKEKSNSKYINSELEKYDTFLEQTISFAKLHKIAITNEYLYNEFEKEFKLAPKQKIGETKDFFKLIDIFIERVESGLKTTRKGTTITLDRINQYKRFKKTLVRFRENIMIDDIDLNFYNELLHFLNNDRKNDKEKQKKSLNYIGHQLKILKAILRDTYKHGLHNNRIFEVDDFKTFAEDIENVYLNNSELDILWNLDNLSPKLSLVRDVFLIGCYTGLRISDLSQLHKSQIVKSGKVLKVITEKTKEIVFIPLHWRVKEIVKTYAGEFPKAFSDQKMNEYIKDICKEIEGFKIPNEYKKTIGGKVVKYTQMKWERITNHTARRSFATNLYLAGFDTISIMKLTGHQSEKAFMKYICVTQEQMADRMVDHPYFKKPKK